MPRPLLIFSQSCNLIQIVDISSYTEWQTVQIQISWLLQKPTDLDLHCLQRQAISGFSMTRVKTPSNICFGYLLEIFASLRQFLQISKTYVFGGNKNKTMSFLHIILSIKNSLQQQIQFNGNIFGNKCCCCNEGSLYTAYQLLTSIHII